MSAIFDTIKYANDLKAAGVQDRHAQAEANAVAEIVQTLLKELATKQELMEAKTELKHDIALLRVETKAEINRVETTLKVEIAQSANKMLLWLGGLIFASSASIIGILLHIGKIV